MKDAYEVAALIWKTRLTRSDKDSLESLRQEEVLVAPGKYDRMQEVLDLLDIPYTQGVPDLKARRLAKLMLVNCPGNVLEGHIAAVKRWVRLGGYLVTTDWAVRPLHSMFPNYIRWTGESTDDTTVELDSRDEAADSLTDEPETAERPVWWLEGSSYPFQVTEDVKILLTSQELKRRYGSSLVAVSWNYGQGKVFHMISHLYLQRTDLRSVQSTATLQETGATHGFDEDALSTLDDRLLTVTEGALTASLASSGLLFDILLDTAKSKTEPEVSSPTRSRRSARQWVD